MKYLNLYIPNIAILKIKENIINTEIPFIIVCISTLLSYTTPVFFFPSYISLYEYKVTVLSSISKEDR